ncbi:MAG: hypothetical protein QXW57_04085, partial [Candidatus Micrarchaeaceae archaeon]
SSSQSFTEIVYSNITEVANYGEQFYVTVNANPSVGGSTSPASGWYNAGTQITFSETPNSGSGYEYVFTGWSGTYSSSSPSFTETVNQPITETATFMSANAPIHTTSISIVNSQSSSAPSPFQVMFTFDPANYTSYEASNLGNIRFYYPNGTELYAWLESYSGEPSGGSANEATSATVWISLHGIAASSSVTIYMEFLPTSNNFDTNYWGEAPQLSPTYVQYDNGPKVFLYYQNFNGTTLPSSWDTTGATGAATVDNGLTLNSANVDGYVFTLTNSWTGSYTVDAYMTEPTDNYIGISYCNLNTQSTGDPLALGVITSGGWQYAAGDIINSKTYYENVLVTTDATQTGAVPSSGYEYPDPSWAVFSLGMYSGNAYSLINYHLLATHSTTTTGLNYPGLNADGGTYTVRWFRIRTTPPNGVMPTVTIL